MSKVNGYITLIAGILLVTATVAAAGHTIQPIQAQCPSDQPYGAGCVSQEAGPSFGGAVSGLAKQNGGLQDFRASGCGANQFATTQHGAHDVC